ncbi:MAG: ParB/RepB/Spo0J family partition protein, partial [Halapricum sp.]
DGHHRVKAAHRLGIEEMDAYVIVIDESVDLGMADTAAKEELQTIEDIEAVDYAHHPLVETTKRLQEEG